MSRVMEIVAEDPVEIVAKRARKAFIRIGRLDEFTAEESLSGRVGVEGYTAYVTVHWVPAKGRVRLDIRARSDDQLSRAADLAMYRFLDAYKEVGSLDLDKPDPVVTKRLLTYAVVALVVIAYLVYALWFAPKH